ncbi:MAG: M23 family metallopeptidase, partial [Bacteroidota bacterium]
SDLGVQSDVTNNVQSDVRSPLTSNLTSDPDIWSALTPDGTPNNIPNDTRLDPPSISPLADDLKRTASFGDSRHPITKQKRFHRGIDFRASTGTPVLAAGAGEVLEVGDKGNYGNCIIIVHDEIYQTLYAHLASIEVKAGDYLTAGQVIGTVGSTGMSTGPHLHYEVIKNGKRVNPADYLP